VPGFYNLPGQGTAHYKIIIFLTRGLSLNTAPLILSHLTYPPTERLLVKVFCKNPVREKFT